MPDIDSQQIIPALNNKADRDMQNLSTEGKGFLAGLGMPSNNYIDLTLNTSGATYDVARANGYITFYKMNGTSGQHYAGIHLLDENNNFTYIKITYSASSAEDATEVTTPILKGQKFQLYYNATGNTERFRFIYAEGEI